MTSGLDLPQKGAKGLRRSKNVDQELLSLLERLSLQLGAQQRQKGGYCSDCGRRCSRRPGSRPARPSSAPSQRRAAAKGTAWVPSEAPPEKAKGKSKSGKAAAPKAQRRSRSLEDKAPSPRPPRRSGSGPDPGPQRGASVPQLRASVEVRPRRRATPKASTKRPPVELPPKTVEPTVPPAPLPESKLRGGRRSSRNLLAELAAPQPPTLWEPVTAAAFEPPSRKLIPKVSEPRAVETREIFYGSPEKPGELCPNCGRTFTEDSIFCRHCGCKRPSKTEKEGPNLSAVRFTSAAPAPAPPPAEPLNLDSATRQLEQLVQETHQALVRDGIINGENATVPSATPNLDAVDRALEELQRGLLEIDHVLAKPMPDAPTT